MTNIKQNLRAYYNQEADIRNSGEKQDWKLQIRQHFYDTAKAENKQTLLELGAGTGHDSQFFMENGLQVVAIDLSAEMVKRCKEKSIEAYEMDFYDLGALGKTFDCIWAMNSLLHTPKADLPQVLQGINTVLNPNGLFYMGVYGGVNSENEYVNERAATPRFFSFYTDEELQEVLARHFEILSFKHYDLTTGASEFFKQNNRGAVDFQSVVLRKMRG